MAVREATFILDKPRLTKPTFIMLRFTCDDEPLKTSTQQKILPGEWNAAMQRGDVTKNKELSKVNRELNRFAGLVDEYVKICQNENKKIFKTDLKAFILARDHRVPKKEVVKENQNDFFKCMAEIVRLTRNGEIFTKQRTRYDDPSITNWERSILKLKEFNAKMDFNKITIETYFAFIKFCNDKNYTANYTGKLIKDWKVLLKHAHVKGFHNNSIYAHPEFKKIKEESKQIYLDEDEIQILYSYDLSDRKYLETIRDRFIINLFTGFRVSDMKTFTDNNITDDTIYHINKKTDKEVAMPVHPLIDEIRNKYGGKLPHQHHDVVVNREIKLIAKAAGFTKRIRYTKTVGGVTRSFIKEKWQMISCHTCRRSMATNLLKHTDIMSAKDVMGMSLETLELYNKRSIEENAKMLRENSFFKK